MSKTGKADPPVDQGNDLCIELTTTSVKENEHIYLTGEFNDWQTRDERFRLQKINANRFEFRFPQDFVVDKPLAYKYVKGSWKTVELDDWGNKTPNRIISDTKGTIRDFVPRWMDNGKAYKSALLPEIRLISAEFEIPQLIKTRRITALLPAGYSHSQGHYPVLYLQDGQNLFDEHAPFGTWGVDKKLAILAEKGMGDIIVIAIDHAEKDRIAEFTPSAKNPKGIIGEGKKYTRFLAETLKPYVDANFRTLTDHANTGIGGSSMGGLISIYAGLRYPEVYSKLLIFSPSLWMEPELPDHTIDFNRNFDTKIYIYAGGKESIYMLPNIQHFKERVLQQAKEGSRIEFQLAIDPEGIHNERHWGRAFPKAIEWLFFSSS